MSGTQAISDERHVRQAKPGRFNTILEKLRRRSLSLSNKLKLSSTWTAAIHRRFFCIFLHRNRHFGNSLVNAEKAAPPPGKAAMNRRSPKEFAQFE